MKRIGILSDTHGFIDPAIYTFFAECDEIWHVGDFGNLETLNTLAKFKPLRGVYGNIDGQEIRVIFKKHLKFRCEEVKVWMTHIGGYPGHYDQSVKPGIVTDPPDLFISGHSHILKVMYDKKLKFLHINPGAAGNTGFHQVKTLLRFVIDGKNIRDLEVMEIKRNKDRVATPNNAPE
ncbi:MAG TPA: metallophosphoesterase family protein [Prolixibacteraceae bacterium]|nr:metallophosphoesterase family protein [Prolixibacteraceae bacterium]HPS13801.1 metallophosphoesterase family protein [Prolixibacteraceae bacterium]